MGKFAEIVLVLVILLSLWPYFAHTNYHEILGVTKGSSKEEIARSYRQLAMKFHPDRYLDEADKAVASERFQEIANAYEFLRKEKAGMNAIRILMGLLITAISVLQGCIAVLLWIAGYGRPKMADTLATQTLLLIFTYLNLVWYPSRIWAWMRFKVKKEEEVGEYDEDEEYFTCETQVYYTCE